MTATEYVNKKLEELEKESDKVEALKKDNDVLSEYEIILDDFELISHEDFSMLIELLKGRGLFEGVDLEEEIQDIKDCIEVLGSKDVKKLLSDEQQKLLEDLSKSVKKLTEEVQKEILKSTSVDNKKLEAFRDWKTLLDEQRLGRRKKYTTEMSRPLMEVIEQDDLSSGDVREMLMEIASKTRNFNSAKRRDAESNEAIIELFSKYLDPVNFEPYDEVNGKGLFLKLLEDRNAEITTNINLAEAEKILEFFKSVGILDKFYLSALVRIASFGDPERVKDFYERNLKGREDTSTALYTPIFSTIWVKKTSNTIDSPFRVRDITPGQGDGKTPYSQDHSVTEEEYDDNVRFLLQNKDLFDPKYDIENKGAFLLAKSISQSQLKEFESVINLVLSPNWSFKKNTVLFRLFGMEEIGKLKITALTGGDLEDKFHLAVELGLLNPPQTPEDFALEQGIARVDVFNKNKDHDLSIRDYFKTKTSKFNLSPKDFLYLAAYQKAFGKEEFYNVFFSDKKAGTLSPDALRIMKNSYPNGIPMDQYIEENFVTKEYCVSGENNIVNYNYYDMIINANNDLFKSYNREEYEGKLQSNNPYSFFKDNGSNIEYYDKSILEDELVKKMDDEFAVYDYDEIRNPFLYKIGDTLISRYKVLHNLSIIKRINEYNNIDEPINLDMIKTSIVRNSFITKDEYNGIIDACNQKVGKKEVKK